MPFVDAHNYQHDDADIFISASHIDWPRVRILAEKLAAADFRVFHSARGMVMGVNYQDVVDHYLQHSGSIVVCWSPHSANSQWVKAEALYGMDQNLLVACKVASCRLMPPFNSFQTADLSDWHGDDAHPQWKQLLQLLLHRKSGAVAAYDPTRRLLAGGTATGAAPPAPRRKLLQLVLAAVALLATLLLGIAIGALRR
jgi:hypothetical protein